MLGARQSMTLMHQHVIAIAVVAVPAAYQDQCNDMAGCNHDGG